MAGNPRPVLFPKHGLSAHRAPRQSPNVTAGSYAAHVSATVNTISRGGGGVQFEHRVGADLLSRLLTRSGIAALDDAFEITKVVFQSDDAVDDFKVVATHDLHGTRTLHVAARRKPGLRPSDEKFVRLVASMLDQLDADPAAFEEQRARLGLAVRGDTPGLAGLRTICLAARSDPASDLRSRVHRPGAFNSRVRDRYDALLDVVALARPTATDADQTRALAKLLFALYPMSYRLEDDDAADRTVAIDRLGIVGLHASEGTAAVAALEALAGGYAPAGAVVDASRLRRDLQPLARIGRSTRHSDGWALLDQLRAAALLTAPRLVGPSGTAVTIQRAELQQELTEAFVRCGTQAGTLAITGEASTGKSAAALRVAEGLAGDGQAVFCLNLRDVPGGDTGLDTAFTSLLDALSEAPVAPCRALVVDGCEAIVAGKSRALELLAQSAASAGLGLVVVVRDDLLLDVQTLLGTGACERLDVHQLTDSELSQLAEQVPALAPAVRTERSRQVVARVGLAALLVQSLAGAPSDVALSEAMVMRTVWDGLIRRRDDPPSASSPDDRAAAVEATARAALGAASALPNGITLERLRLDRVLGRAPVDMPWEDDLQFADDAIRDLCVAFVLLKDRFEPLLDGPPKWALRAARIAAQAQIESSADTPEALEELQNLFDALAAAGGERWSEIPTEALLTVREPERTLTAAGPWLFKRSERTSRLLRVLRQRHRQDYGVIDPVVATPVMALLVDNVQLLPSRGDLAEQCSKVLIGWLEGLSLRDGDDPDPTRAAYVPLLATDEYPDDDIVEALALLGPDRADGTAYLRNLAQRQPSRLRAAMESNLGPFSLAGSDPALLIELAEAYYVEDPRRNGSWGGFRDDGIRDLHHGHGVGHPFAAPYYGPFWRMLNSAPHQAVAAIDRMVRHALTIRGGTDPAIELDVPRIGARSYDGDVGAWGWYRGYGTGPNPLMSALMAVERFGDHLVRIGMPPSEVLHLVLHRSTTAPMLAVAVGFAVRHCSEPDDYLLEFMRNPYIWGLEKGRASSEIGIWCAGPRDDDSVTGSERRSWDLGDVAQRLMATSVLGNDTELLDRLARVRAACIAKAAKIGGDFPTSVDRDTSVLNAACYTRVESADQIQLRFDPPTWVLVEYEQQMRPLLRTKQCFDLQHRYTIGERTTDTLREDLAVARDIAADPPGAHRPGDTVALVAAAAVRAHADGTVRIPKADLRWAFQVLVEAADMAEDDDQWYDRGADRSAASAVADLLRPRFHEESPRRPVVSLDEIRRLGEHLTTDGSDEVRRLMGLAMEPLWTAPCGPGSAGEPDCRHQVALDLVELSAQNCQLGRVRDDGRRSLDDVELPLADHLDAVPTRNVMLDRLTGAISASVTCSLSGACAAERGAALAQALVRTHRRSFAYWADEGFRYREWDSEPVAAALLALGDAGDSALLDTATELTDHPNGLLTLLTDIRRLATYDPQLRASMVTQWPALFDSVVSKAQDTGCREGDAADEWRSWGEWALAALIPTQEFNISETDHDAVLTASRDGWPTSYLLADQIDPWLELAVGRPRCVDAIARLLWTEPDPTVGLGWLEQLVAGHADHVAGRTGSLHIWFEELAGRDLPPSAEQRFDRLVDLLAAAGDDAMAKLQRD